MLKLATPGNTSGIKVGYQVCPINKEVFDQSILICAWRNRNKPIVFSVFPKKSPSNVPEILAPQTLGPLTLAPNLETTDKKFEAPVSFKSAPFGSKATSKGYKFKLYSLTCADFRVSQI